MSTSTRSCRAFALAPTLLLTLTALLSACRAPPLATTSRAAPYPVSRAIPGVQWQWSDLDAQRRAHGSDIWPCAWASDDNLYCAWGDGGGFDGDADEIGRASLGFAQIGGMPSGATGWDTLKTLNVWGTPPWAQMQATFGGKVGSMLAADGVLYAIGRFWSPTDTPDAVHKSGAGPFYSIAWSSDLARHWTVAPRPSPDMLGTFLDRGRPGADGNEYVHLYYFRASDDQHLYLKRVRASGLRTATLGPRSPDRPIPDQPVEYYAGHRLFGLASRWSPRESDAVAIFTDPHHVEGPYVLYAASLHRYLLTAGHYPGTDDDDSSVGRWGLFESRHAWGPWHTIAYYDDWGGLDARTRGDYLGFRLPSKWVSADGRELWGVYSGLHEFDSFNLVRGELTLRGKRAGLASGAQNWK